jgi:hypothetical protein
MVNNVAIWEDECELKQTIKQMKNLEEKFKGLVCKNKGKSQTNSVENKSMKQNDSSSKSNVIDAKEVIESHLTKRSYKTCLTKMNVVFSFEETQHRQSQEVLASSLKKNELNKFWVLDLGATHHVTWNPNIIYGLKPIIATPMITT